MCSVSIECARSVQIGVPALDLFYLACLMPALDLFYLACLLPALDLFYLACLMLHCLISNNPFCFLHEALISAPTKTPPPPAVALGVVLVHCVSFE